jgi:hypothetical protein
MGYVRMTLRMANFREQADGVWVQDEMTIGGILGGSLYGAAPTSDG